MGKMKEKFTSEISAQNVLKLLEDILPHLKDEPEYRYDFGDGLDDVYDMFLVESLADLHMNFDIPLDIIPENLREQTENEIEKRKAMKRYLGWCR